MSDKQKLAQYGLTEEAQSCLDLARQSIEIHEQAMRLMGAQSTEGESVTGTLEQFTSQAKVAQPEVNYVVWRDHRATW